MATTTTARAALVRVVLGSVCALALSACQSPWTASLPADPQVALAPEPPTVSPEELRGDEIRTRVAALLLKRAPLLSPVDRARVARAVEQARHKHGVEPELVLAVIHQESHFRPTARGPRGSLGLMQVRPFVAEDVARRNGIPWAGHATLFDPAANVEIGACYLGEMLDMFEDPGLAIAAYNMGPYRVRRLVASGRPPKPAYLVSVLKHVQSISSELGPIAPAPAADALGE